MSKDSASSSSGAAALEVSRTGRAVDGIVLSLIKHAADADDAVRSQIAFALHDIGAAEPLLVCSSLATFMQRTPKLDQTHRIVLHRALAQMLETQTARDAIAAAEKTQQAPDNVLVTNLIKFCAKEMTSAQDVVTDISVPCCTCLNLLGGVNCTLVVDECLSLFPAGQLPHYYVVKTLADVAANHPVTFVQKLKEVMARMTPVIGQIKKSPMKWVFATAYGRFSESMGHYHASCAEAGTNPEISAASFEIHMASAFDVMFNSWLPHEPEPKVRYACLESLGHMCMLLDRPALESRLPKLIPAYLLWFKKEKFQDHLPISHGLCSTLKEAVKTNALTLGQPQTLMQQVLLTLHPLVSRPVDFAHPSTAKNHNELLRCFEILLRYDLELILQFVVGRGFQNKERDPRLSSLIILRHFVNSANDLLEADKKPVIMSSVLTLLGEQDLLLKKTLMQLIVSMANQQYLTQEGGQQLIKFILQQCSLLVEGEDREGRMVAAAGPRLLANADGATPLQIRNAGNHILGVMATKVPSTHPVLWPYLMELIVEPEFNRAGVILFKVLEHVASVKRAEEQPDYLINWEAQVNMPPPQALLCRMMILACEPFRARGEAGLVMCRAMGALGPLIHPSVGKYFDESAPSLVAHLEAHTQESLNVSKWQDTLLKMWKETLGLIENAKWMQDLATALGEQFKLYKNDPALLRCVHRYLGATLARIESRATLQTGIDLMLNTVNHASDVERQGCAQGMGLAASVHLDVVLPKLTERLTPKVVEKKSTGFFGFGGGSSSPPVGPDGPTLSTIVLCYGYVAAYANPELILSRLDVHILHNILPLLPKARSTLLRVHLIKSIDLIGKAVHATRLPEAKKNWKLAQRDELLSGLINFLDNKAQSGGKDSSNSSSDKKNGAGGSETAAERAKAALEIKLLGVNALATLSNLEPPIPSELRRRLTEAVFPFYGVTAAGEMNARDDGSAAAAGSKSPLKSPAAAASPSPSSPSGSDGGGSDGTSGENGESMLEMIMANLNTLLSSIVQMEPTVPSLVELLRLLEPWSASARTVERERACASYLIVLKKFISKLVHEKVSMAPATGVPDLGHFLSVILCRCNDSSLAVRQTATENVQALLYIQQVLQNPDNPKPVQEIKLITDIRNRLDEAASDDRLVILRDMCSLLTAVVGTSDLIVLLQGLLTTGLLDSDQSAAQGSALIFKTLLYSKASEMQTAVKPLLTGILAAVKVLRVGEVVEIALAALRILTRVHFDLVVRQLLEGSPMPVPREVMDAVEALVETGPIDPSQAPVRPVGMEAEWDVALAERVLLHYIEVINETPLEKDKPTPIVQCATACMANMVRVESARPLLDKHYSALLCTFLMRVGTSSGVAKVVAPGGKDAKDSKDNKASKDSKDKEAAPRANSSKIDACSAVRALLESTGEDVLLKKLDEARVWPVLEGRAYDDAMTSFTRCFSEVHPDRKRSLLQFLAKFYSQQSYTGQRIVATAMLAEFVNHCTDDVVLLREVIKFLLPRVADKVEKVRKQALRGLGHLVTVWNAETALMATSVLSSLTAAAEDADAEVAAEAVHSLTRIAGVVSEALIGPMLISICFRLRPAFDRKEEMVRARAFTLFGALCRFGAADAATDEGVKANFIDQVHANVSIFVVHSNDAAESVRKATVEGFRQLVPLLGADFIPVLAEVVGDPHEFDELVQRLAPLLNQHHPDRLRGYLENSMQYFTATSISIRANAAYFTGLVLSTASPEQRRSVSIPSVTSELLKLLDDGQATVRSRAAKSLSLCHHL